MKSIKVTVDNKYVFEIIKAPDFYRARCKEHSMIAQGKDKAELEIKIKSVIRLYETSERLRKTLQPNV